MEFGRRGHRFASAAFLSVLSKRKVRIRSMKGAPEPCRMAAQYSADIPTGCLSVDSQAKTQEVVDSLTHGKDCASRS